MTVKIELRFLSVDSASKIGADVVLQTVFLVMKLSSCWKLVDNFVVFFCAAAPVHDSVIFLLLCT